MDQTELRLKSLQLNCITHTNEEIAFLNLNPHLNDNPNPNLHNALIKTRLFCHKCNIDDLYIRPLDSIENLIKSFNLKQFEQNESLLLDLENKFQNRLESIRNNLQKIEIDFFKEIAELRLLYLQPDLLQTINGKPYLKAIDLQHLGDILSKAVSLEQDQIKIKCQSIKTTDLDQLKGYIKQIDNGNQQLEIINSFKPIIYDDKYRSQQITLNKIKIENFILNIQENTLIVAGSDHCIYIYQLQENAKWKEIAQLNQHNDHISSIIINLNSNMIISTSKDKNINVWKLNSKNEWTLFQKITSHTSWVKEVQLNQKENEFASCGEDQTISIWRQKSNCQWEQYQMLKSHQDYVYSISYNKDSNLMASGGGDKQVIIWIYQYSQWKQRQLLQAHENEVYKVRFSKHSNQLCSASWDKTIILWTIEKNGLFISTQKLIGHNAGLKNIQFNSNSNILASSSKDRVLKVWQKTQDCYKCTQTIEQNFESISIQFSKDSKRMYTCSQDSLIIYQQL